MSNRTFVCFDCRTTERVDTARVSRKCRKCRQPAEYVHYKFRIPKKDDEKGWDSLMARVRPFNDSLKRDMLIFLRRELARIEKALASKPLPRGARERRLRRQLRDTSKSLDQWLA